MNTLALALDWNEVQNGVVAALGAAGVITVALGGLAIIVINQISRVKKALEDGHKQIDDRLNRQGERQNIQEQTIAQVAAAVPPSVAPPSNPPTAA